MVTDKPSQPPALDEIEVSVFGPGYGECVVAHVGEGQWLVVDSCRDPATGEPSALVYLRSLGVPTESVKWVVASHWHDDHVNGIAEVVKRCEAAEFCCASALRTDEFLRLIGFDATGGSRAMRELEEVLETLASRQRTPIWLSTGRVIFQDGLRQLIALSPSDADYNRTLDELSQWLPKYGDPKRSIRAMRPNHCAVALYLRVGEARVLLGSDVERTSASDSGWNSVVANTSGTLALGPSKIVKVAHHGAESGDHPEVWRQLIETDPVAMLTPFRLGGTRLPTSTDLQRLQAHADRVYLTASPRGTQVRRSRTSERLIREFIPTLSLREDRRSGQVRCRVGRDGHDPIVRLTGTATTAAALLTADFENRPR